MSHENTSPRPFVGRRRELAELTRALAEARSGQGGFSLILGEPGIGKTRLLEEVARRARDEGMRVLAVTCGLTPRTGPYQPWVEILRELADEIDLTTPGLVPEWGVRALVRMVPSLAARMPRPVERGASLPIDDPEGQFRLHDALTTLLAHAGTLRPLVIILDDLHEADSASLSLVAFLARQVNVASVALLATSRETDERRASPAAQAFHAVASEIRILALRGLPEADVRELTEIVAGVLPPAAFAAELHRLSNGNPLFVLELLGSLGREAFAGNPELAEASLSLPERARKLMLRRVVSLGERAREAIEVASVLGVTFSPTMLREVAGLSFVETLDVLEEMIRAGVILEPSHQRGEHSFSHALMRESTYEEIPEERRRELHQLVTRALERRYTGDLDEVAPELAHHAFQSEDVAEYPRAVTYSTRAAERALTRFGYEEAAEHFARALRALEQLPGVPVEARCELRLGLADAWRRAGEFGLAEQGFRLAVEEARSAARPHDFARAVLGLGVVRGSGVEAYDESGQVDPVLVALLEEALALLPAGESDPRARLLGRLAVSLYWEPRALGRRQQLCAEATAMATRSGDPSVLAAALASKYLALWGPDDPEARLGETGEILRLARLSGDLEREIQAREWRLWNLMELGRIAEADQEIQRYTALADGLRQPFYRAYAILFRAMRRYLEGRLDEGDELGAEAAGIGERAGRLVSAELYRSQLFHSALIRGRPNALEPLVEPLLRDATGLLPVARCVLLFVLTELGRYDLAREGFEVFAAEGFAGIPRDLTWRVATFHLSRVSAALGDAERSRMLFRQLSPLRGQSILVGPPPAVVLGQVSHALGLLAAAFGDRETAAACFEDASRESAALGARILEAETRCAYGTLLLGSEPVRARALLESSLAAARELGLAGVAGRAEGALAPRASHAPIETVPARNVFHGDGETWQIVYEGRVTLLKEGKGIRYIAMLLERPGVEVHVRDLSGKGSRRGRRAPNDAERVRKAVTNRIRSAIARIARHDPSLARHLRDTIRTGTRCRYEPAVEVGWSVRT